MRFDTPIYHPNHGSRTGAICLDALSKNASWSPALTVQNVLLMIQARLSTPFPADPQDPEVARVCRDDPELFRQTAAEWTRRYAQPQPIGAAAEREPSASAASSAASDAPSTGAIS